MQTGGVVQVLVAPSQLRLAHCALASHVAPLDFGAVQIIVAASQKLASTHSTGPSGPAHESPTVGPSSHVPLEPQS